MTGVSETIRKTLGDYNYMNRQDFLISALLFPKCARTQTGNLVCNADHTDKHTVNQWLSDSPVFVTGPCSEAGELAALAHGLSLAVTLSLRCLLLFLFFLLRNLTLTAHASMVRRLRVLAIGPMTGPGKVGAGLAECCWPQPCSS